MRNKLKIESKKKLFAKLQGEHISPFSGSSIEFLELKEYSYLDNAKHINWKRSASSRTPLVNIYSDDRELNIVVVYLVSGSLEFKDKKHLAKEVTSTLCFSATKFKERLTLLFFSNKEEAFFESLRENSFDISYQSAQKLEHLGKRIDYNKLSDFLNSYLKVKSLIFLVGDFLEIPSNLEQLSFKHELFAIIIRDKAEEQISPIGHTILKDAISLKIKSLFISKSGANAYNKAIKKFDRELFNKFNNIGIRYTKIYKSNEILNSLKRLINGNN